MNFTSRISDSRQHGRAVRAFTLIELLVVIAITAILMTLIIVPVVQSFNLTRAAQGWAEAQDKARTLTERIAREINSSVSVRDNTGPLGRLDIVVAARPGSGVHGLTAYDAARDWIRVSIFNAKIDIVKPFEGDPSLMSGGAFINPLNGLIDPTLTRPRGQVNVPSSAGFTIVRYFVGLRDPLRKTDQGTYAGYLEPYTGLLQQRDAVRDNLYVLYRAEVQPMVWNATLGRFIVNKAFFFDQGRYTPSKKTGPLIDDPTFFDPSVINPAYDVPDPAGTADPTKEQMVQNWLRAAVVQTEVSRFDMIQPVYDLNSRRVTFDNDAPRLMTLIQFRPTRVSSEPAAGQTAVRQSEESDSSKQIAPDVFLTKHPGWANSLVRSYPQSYVQSQAANNQYTVGIALRNPGLNDAPGFSNYLIDPDQGYEDILAGQLIGAVRVGVEVFDTDTYQRGIKSGYRANYSRAMAAANSRSGWLSNAGIRSLFEPFVPDFDRGRLLYSYGIDENGVVGGSYPFQPVALPDPTYNSGNLPSGKSWDPTKVGFGDPTPNEPKSPFNDYPRDVNNMPDLSAGTFSDAQYSTINRKFNKLWFDYPGLRGNIQRFLDMRLAPNDDGAPSPLNPDPAIGFVRARIVPGSDQVFGPDQNPGPHYGKPVRYTRTTHEPGPNQYRINYTDLAEPTDYRLLGGATATAPAVYTPTDFVSAVLQPRFKAGYIQFNSDPNVPLPGDDGTTNPLNEAKILVYYRFQFSQPHDAVAVDYDSRELMTVQMTIRDYPQSSLPNPQTVTLHSTATVRNFLR